MLICVFGCDIITPRGSIGKWISVLYRHIHIYINKKLEKYNISSGQFPVMLVLLRNDKINQETIAENLNLDKATVGRAVVKLMKEGYVSRSRDPNDKRAYILRITAKGQELEPVIKKISSKVTTILFTDFQPDEKEIAFKLLKKMYMNLTKPVAT
jgi:DNA-binding MarR family transcriptional regulator